MYMYIHVVSHNFVINLPCNEFIVDVAIPHIHVHVIYMTNC